MTRPDMAEGSRRRMGAGVDARKLWSGGVASAIVAGLVALVGVLVTRWLFNLPVLAPRRDQPPPYGRPQPYGRPGYQDRAQPQDRTQPYDRGWPGTGSQP